MINFQAQRMILRTNIWAVFIRMYQQVKPRGAFAVMSACVFCFFMGCSSSSDEESIIQNMAEDMRRDSIAEVEIDETLIFELINSIPSPIEISSIIQSSGAEYSEAYICSTEEADALNSNFNKALALGLFGADLGYMEIYNENLSMMDHLSTIKSLATDLGVGQFYNFNTLKRLSEQKNNMDSMLQISAMSFSRMNNYLKDNQRANISLLILTGTWIEGMHLATSMYNKSLNPDLKERIGEQKVTLDNLMLMLEVYKEDEKMAGLVGEMKHLQDAFEKVNIEYTYGEMASKVVDGKLVIEDNNTSTVEISDEVVEEIRLGIQEVRNYTFNK